MADDPADWSTPRVASGVLFFDDEGRVLVVHPTYKDALDVPGGYVNAGETPREAATREVREELGLDVELGSALVVDWAPRPGEGDKVLFLFDGGVLDTDAQSRITLQSEELSEFSFLSLTECQTLLIERLAQRVTAGVEAREQGLTSYLENGRNHSTSARGV